MFFEKIKQYFRASLCAFDTGFVIKHLVSEFSRLVLTPP